MKGNFERAQFSVVADIGIGSSGCGLSRFPVLCGSRVLFAFPSPFFIGTYVYAG